MAECTSSSSSWSNVSSANQRYRDLDTAAMHFWIDKRGAEGTHGGPGGHGGRYRHRVSASLSSARLPPGAAPQRRRRPGRPSRAAAPKQALVPVHRGTAGSDASSSGTAALGLAGASSTAGSSSRRGPGQSPAASTAPGPLLSRAARAHLALPRPRPHLAYIGSTGSGIRAHGGHGVAGSGLGGVLVDLPLEAGHGHPNSVLGASSSGSDRGDVFGLGALPLPAHGETGPVLMDRFTCGLWASFALASVFVAGTKFYLDFQSSGMEAMVLSLLLMIFLMVGCTASICRARVNSQLAAAAAAATASALREPGPGLAASQLQAALQLQQPAELAVLISGADGTGQQEQLLQQVQQEQLAEQQQSGEPPPPYHIAMLDEQPPPAYEKVFT